MAIRNRENMGIMDKNFHQEILELAGKLGADTKTVITALLTILRAYHKATPAHNRQELRNQLYAFISQLERDA